MNCPCQYFAAPSTISTPQPTDKCAVCSCMAGYHSATASVPTNSVPTTLVRTTSIPTTSIPTVPTALRTRIPTRQIPTPPLGQSITIRREPPVLSSQDATTRTRTRTQDTAIRAAAEAAARVDLQPYSNNGLYLTESTTRRRRRGLIGQQRQVGRQLSLPVRSL